MSINVEITEKQLNAAKPLQMHYLPAKICGDGEANVDKYFNNYTREEGGHMTNALRGYPLQGVELDVPENYKAVVLQETRKPLDEDADRTLRVTGTFSKFNYWNYDKIPSDADGYKQALQFIGIAEELAKPVTEADVLAEIERQKQRPASKENDSSTT